MAIEKVNYNANCAAMTEVRTLYPGGAVSATVKKTACN